MHDRVENQGTVLEKRHLRRLWIGYIAVGPASVGEGGERFYGRKKERRSYGTDEDHPFHAVGPMKLLIQSRSLVCLKILSVTTRSCRTSKSSARSYLQSRYFKSRKADRVLRCTYLSYCTYRNTVGPLASSSSPARNHAANPWSCERSKLALLLTVQQRYHDQTVETISKATKLFPLLGGCLIFQKPRQEDR